MDKITFLLDSVEEYIKGSFQAIKDDLGRILTEFNQRLKKLEALPEDAAAVSKRVRKLEKRLSQLEAKLGDGGDSYE